MLAKPLVCCKKNKKMSFKTNVRCPMKVEGVLSKKSKKYFRKNTI